VSVAVAQQMIDENGRGAADVEDPRITIRVLGDEIQGPSCDKSEPATDNGTTTRLAYGGPVASLAAVKRCA